jgi:hypothetical protein
MAHTDQELDRLLARGRLGGPGRDRVLEGVLQQQARAERRTRARFLAWGTGVMALAAAASGVVVVVAPRARPVDDGIRPKSAVSGVAAPAWLDLACSGGTLEACPRGATLLFGVAGAARAGFLAAYAEPEAGSGARERIWYFSAESETPAVAASGDGVGLAPRGIRVGPEHAPGGYVVHVFLCAQPLGREALLRGDNPAILDRLSVPLRVVAP